MLLASMVNAGAANPPDIEAHSPIVIAYLGADSKWNLSPKQKQQLADAFGKNQHRVDVVDYAFIRFGTDESSNPTFNVTQDDLANLNIIKGINPQEPIILSIGGWGARDQFGFVADPQKRHAFETSVINQISTLRQQKFNIKGIDVDWENEQLAPQAEIDGVGQLIVELHQLLLQDKNSGGWVTNAVPASPAYWMSYPATSIWASSVKYTTVMAYDHYGTFGPKAELGASLYENKLNQAITKQDHYPYTPTSGNLAVQHYYKGGLPAKKILLGLPFYCHSYYISGKYASNPLGAPVLDPNISSQISYNQAISQYGLSGLNKYSVSETEGLYSAPTYFGLFDVKANQHSYLQSGVYQFMSCDIPGPSGSIAYKMHYVKGNNPLNKKLGGVSFWSLLQDVDVIENGSENPQSLLVSVNKYLHS